MDASMSKEGLLLPVRYWMVFVVLLFIPFCVRPVYAESGTEVRLLFQGNPVNPEVKILTQDTRQYINLFFLLQYLRMTADWNPDTGLISLQFGKCSYNLTEGQLKYQVDGVVQYLTAAPFEAGNQLWFPLDFLAKLGVVAQPQNDRTLALDWAQDWLLAIEKITYQGRPALRLTGSKPLAAKSFLLQEPDRLVVDLTGVKAHPALSTAYEADTMIKQIRLGQFNAETLRLVLELTRARGYQIIADPKNSRQLIVVFNYLVQHFNFITQEDGGRFQIKTEYPAVYTVHELSNPPRTVIDFTGATLANQVAPPRLETNKCFQRARVSQFDPHTVRVVLDLTKDNPKYQVITSRTNPGLVEARTVQKVRALQWVAPTPEGGRLIIDCDGEIIATHRKLKNPTRVQIDLSFCQFIAGLQAPEPSNSDLIKGIRMVPLDATTIRVEVELNYVAGYELHFSGDYRQLTLVLKESPIVGKSLMLDPGHGGVDQGAHGAQGLLEKNVNLEVTMRLQELLAEAGAKVVLTRNDDYYISLYERSFLANQLQVDLFISIHTNFHPNPEVRGIEVFHYSGRAESALLAEYVEKELAEATKFTSLGVKTNDFVVIREGVMPSILVEMGFLSNAAEEAIINTSKFKEQAALGIYQGIIAYYNAKKPVNEQGINRSEAQEIIPSKN
jgi:N-acetylmuramoyl-L-alanine amidase